MVAPKDTMKQKQFQKGVQQLAQEGAIQVYHNEYNEVVIGAVGQLQFEVFQYRLENEYNAPLRMTPLDFSVAKWVKNEDLERVKSTVDARTMLLYDRFDRPVMLFANPFTLNFYLQRFDWVELLDATEV